MQLSFLGVRLHTPDAMKCDMHMFVSHSKLFPSPIQLKLNTSLSEWSHMGSGNPKNAWCSLAENKALS